LQTGQKATQSNNSIFNCLKKVLKLYCQIIKINWTSIQGHSLAT